MQIDRASGIDNVANLNMNGSEQRPPPPPKGTVPRGLEDATASLSLDQQEQVSSLLSGFSKEQHDQLKLFLDNLKPDTDDMTPTEIGESFLAGLQDIASQKTVQTDALIDIYA